MTVDTTLTNLEDALGDIHGVASVLDCLSFSEVEEDALKYLARQLMKHYADAHDAFSRIYKLDKYNARREGGAS